jgi:exoribonuclease R
MSNTHHAHRSDRVRIATEAMAAGAVRIRVAIADFDALVAKGSASDTPAWTNTTTVCTSARILPMRPGKLSTDLTSLNAGQALQLRTQDEVTQRPRRRDQGSLEPETFQPRAVFDGERVVEIRQQEHSRARQRIEELMIAPNGCTAQPDAVRKTDRRRRKREAALLLQSHIGEQFDAVVTGAPEVGTWVRILAPPAEGKLVAGAEEPEVGRQVRVKPVATNAERGFIDVVRVD